MPRSMFRTPEGQARYYAAYDATLALWPVDVSSLAVSTQFGLTHVNVCGPENAPALLLLHGSATSSTMWYPNVAALSQTYRLFAPDIMGEMGKSVCTRMMKTPADYIDWLLGLIDGLRLDQMSVIGISFGGFLAMQLANAASERVMKLVLLSPATLLPFRPSYYLRLFSAIFLPSISLKTRQALFLGTATENALPMVKQLMTKTDFQYKMFFPPVTSDDELRQIQASTLLLMGKQEVIYKPQAALQRATSLIPHIEAEIIPDAGHALNLDQPDKVNQRILTFLATS